MVNEQTVVLEGVGTEDEMEAHLITELRRRGCFHLPAVERVVFEETPAEDVSGPYRLRIHLT